MKIYVLKLEDSKYYVGKTDNIEERLYAHKNKNGCAWTKKYKFVEVEDIIDSVSIFDEDKITKEYMYKYGINNVRGGSYVQVILTYDQIKLLKKEIWMATNCCVKCGRNTHFVKNCYAKKDINGDAINKFKNKGKFEEAIENKGKLGESIENKGNLEESIENKGKLGESIENKGKLEETVENKGEKIEPENPDKKNKPIRYMFFKMMDGVKEMLENEYKCVKCGGKGHLSIKCTKAPI